MRFNVLLMKHWTLVVINHNPRNAFTIGVIHLNVNYNLLNVSWSAFRCNYNYLYTSYLGYKNQFPTTVKYPPILTIPHSTLHLEVMGVKLLIRHLATNLPRGTHTHITHKLTHPFLCPLNCLVYLLHTKAKGTTGGRSAIYCHTRRAMPRVTLT